MPFASRTNSAFQGDPALFNCDRIVVLAELPGEVLNPLVTVPPLPLRLIVSASPNMSTCVVLPPNAPLPLPGVQVYSIQSNAVP